MRPQDSHTHPSQYLLYLKYPNVARSHLGVRGSCQSDVSRRDRYGDVFVRRVLGARLARGSKTSTPDSVPNPVTHSTLSTRLPSELVATLCYLAVVQTRTRTRCQRILLVVLDGPVGTRELGRAAAKFLVFRRQPGCGLDSATSSLPPPYT